MGNADPDNTAINVLIWRGWHMAAAAVAVLAVRGAGAILMLHGAGGNTRDRADVRYCGLVTCAALHASGHSGSHSGGAVAIGAPVRIERPGQRPAGRAGPVAHTATGHPAARSDRFASTRTPADGTGPGTVWPGRDHHILHA
jgi:hypothetical protein